MNSRLVTVTQRAVRAISAGSVSVLLVPDGFKRKAPHFWRETDGIYHSVNFQASQWGTNGDGQFTINLGVSLPSLYSSFTGHDFPKNPGSVLWPICSRIGGLMPSRHDLWWRVTDSTDTNALGLEVASALREYGLPFFERFRTAEQFHTLMLSDLPVHGLTAAQQPLIAATLAIELGRADEAHRLLSTALQKHKGKPFESTIRTIATRLQVQLSGA